MDNNDKQHAEHEKLLLRHFDFGAASENYGIVQVPVNKTKFTIINEVNVVNYEKALEALGGKKIGCYGHASDGRIDGLTMSAASYDVVKEKLDTYKKQQLQGKADDMFVGKNRR